MSVLVSGPVYEGRIQICKHCEHYRSFIRQCKICKCIMPVKARLAFMRCPSGKWVEVTAKAKVGSK